MIIFVSFLLVYNIAELMSEVKAANGKCQATLYQGCELVSCRIHCAERYNQQNGDGACVEEKANVYDCVCTYDCNR
jgi:S locus-related glycoprotein 1 binding pollen coat protein (SLR1-BP)